MDDKCSTKVSHIAAFWLPRQSFESPSNEIEHPKAKRHHVKEHEGPNQTVGNGSHVAN